MLYINFRFSNFGTLNPRPTHAQMAVLETKKRFTKLRPTPVQPPAGSVQNLTPAAGSPAEVCQDLVAQSGLPSIVAADLAIAWLHERGKSKTAIMHAGARGLVLSRS